MAKPFGFSYTQFGDGTVTITHRGRAAGTLRGSRAEKFLREVGAGDALVMARWTGAYKFGNERVARNHSRNRWLR